MREGRRGSLKSSAGIGTGETMSEVLLQTTLGELRVELFESTMPVTAGNFRKLVERGFYDGVIFHRVIPGFMIQGGDPTGSGRGGPGYTIKDEFSKEHRNARGTLAMANAGPNTGGSQVFIHVVGNFRLDDKQPVFGKVVAGIEVADAISRVPRNRNDRPVTDVVIRKATVAKS